MHFISAFIIALSSVGIQNYDDHLPFHYLFLATDLMQGESPADAFTSLPASMRGVDESGDDVLSLDPLVPPASLKGVPKERLWSLDKEQVNRLVGVEQYTYV